MNPHQNALVTLSLMALLVPAGGCADETGASPGLRLVTAALGDCTDPGNGDGALPAGIDRVVVTVTGGAIPADSPIVLVSPAAASAGGEVVVDEIPPGEGLSIEVVACSGSAATWSGSSGPESVVVGEPTEVAIFLTPVGQMACVGRVGAPAAETSFSQGHAFAATASDAESAWILGGFGSYTPGNGTLTATAGADRYDRLRSAFSAAPALGEPRAMALGQRLADGVVRLVGGTRKLTLKSAGLPLQVTAADAPAAGVELWDPSSGASAAAVAVALPALPAVTALGDGRALAVGGIGSGDAPVATAWVVDAGGATEIALPNARYGATVVPFGDAQALVWGGRLDSVDGVALWVDAATGTATELGGSAVRGMSIFAAGAPVGGGSGVVRALILGGTDVTDDGTSVKPSANVSAARAELVTIDVGAGTLASEAVDLGTNVDVFRRAAAGLVTLGAGQLWHFGGFTSFVADPACPNASDCIPGIAPRLTASGGTLDILEPRLELSVGPLGATVTPLGDGAWLVGAGLDSVGAAGSVGRGAALVRHEAQVSTGELCPAVPAAPTP